MLKVNIKGQTREHFNNLKPGTIFMFKQELHMKLKECNAVNLRNIKVFEMQALQPVDIITTTITSTVVYEYPAKLAEINSTLEKPWVDLKHGGIPIMVSFGYLPIGCCFKYSEDSRSVYLKTSCAQFVRLTGEDSGEIFDNMPTQWVIATEVTIDA